VPVVSGGGYAMKGKKQASARNEQILELRARGLTLEAIGQRFGLTKERVRQITNRYSITPRFTTLPALMARFGVTRYEVTRAMEDAGLAKERLRQGRYFILSDADLDTIVRHLKLHEVRECAICGKSFDVRGRRHKRFCSPQCFLEHRRRMRTFPPGEERPMSQTTRQIHELLSAEPPGATWVGLREAVRLTGMKTSQLMWLKRRGLIASLPSGECSNFGKPRFLYSAHHCELLGRLVSGHEQRHEQRPE
jgi:transcriptional regulator with XRE-family HTH domain